jgi:hypothetical protein
VDKDVEVLGNYIGTAEPAGVMFRKIMQISTS